jgi:predicted MFS family arabinose efflux permease
MNWLVGAPITAYFRVIDGLRGHLVPTAAERRGPVMARYRAVSARQTSFWIVAFTLGLFLFAAAAPSPLYAVYAAKFHFSAIVLTEVFAVYAIALLVALLLTGSLSDSVGRRPVILSAVAIELVSMVMFVFATSVEWLFLARVTQGIATGIATSPLAASFVDLHSPEHPTLAPTVNSATLMIGIALGALTSAALVQYGPDPLSLVYWLLIAMFAVAAVGVGLMGEPSTARAALHVLPRIGVEPSVRPSFLAALAILIAGWAVGGFYLSLGPSLVLGLAQTSNRLLGGLSIFVLSGVGAACIVAARGWPAGRSMSRGAAALVAGLLFTLASILVGSPTLFIVTTAITGVGFGLAWFGVLRSLVLRASPTGRGALLAAVFIVAYTSFALPAVVAGYLVTRIGLHDAALWYGAAVGLLAVAGVVGTQLVSRADG